MSEHWSLNFGRELRTLDDVQHDVKAIIEDDNFLPQITPYLQNFVTVLKDAKEIEHRQQDRNKANVDQCCLPQPNFTTI